MTAWRGWSRLGVRRRWRCLCEADTYAECWRLLDKIAGRGGDKYVGTLDPNRKTEYVRSQGQTRQHHCHWPGCTEQVPPAMFMCRMHWFRLPKQLRDKIWDAYVPGQEKTMRPSRDYIAAAREVQEWIGTHYPNYR